MQRMLWVPLLTTVWISGSLCGCTGDYFSIESKTNSDNRTTGDNKQWSEALEMVNAGPDADANSAAPELAAGTNTSNTGVAGNETPEQIELGLVAWGRDLERAKRQSSESGNPVLVLFQEVPG